MAENRRKHIEEFKHDTVALIFKSDKGTTKIAADLGIHKSVLVGWHKRFDGYGNKAFPGNGLSRKRMESLMKDLGIGPKHKKI